MKILETRGWKFSSRSPPKGKSVKNEAGQGSSLESMKECVHPGEMSDKLLRWSLEERFSSRSTPKGRIVLWCRQEMKQDLCLKWNRIGSSKAGSVTSV